MSGEAVAGLLGALAGLAMAGVTLATFWMTIGGKVQEATSTSKEALQTAAESENERKSDRDALDHKIEETRGSVTTLSSHFSMYREAAADKFVSKDALDDVETRLVDNQRASENRLASGLNGINQRLDRLIEAGLRSNA